MNLFVPDQKMTPPPNSKIFGLWHRVKFNQYKSPKCKQIKIKKKMRGRGQTLTSWMNSMKNKIPNEISLESPWLKTVSGPALHKRGQDIYTISVDIFFLKKEKRGYSRMVKFLFAKEKTRVRFPLSAQGKVIYLI